MDITAFGGVQNSHSFFHHPSGLHRNDLFQRFLFFALDPAHRNKKNRSKQDELGIFHDNLLKGVFESLKQ
jgi:hypothetical protein